MPVRLGVDGGVVSVPWMSDRLAALTEPVSLALPSRKRKVQVPFGFVTPANALFIDVLGPLPGPAADER